MAYRRTEVKEIVSLATFTGAGSSVWAMCGEYKEAQVFVEVQKASGTLVLYPEVSPDGTVVYPYSFLSLDLISGESSIPVTQVSNIARAILFIGKYFRVRWTITEGGSFDFRVSLVLKT